MRKPVTTELSDAALAVGNHLFGTTEYMVSAEVALGIRLLSAFQVFLPIIAAHG